MKAWLAATCAVVLMAACSAAPEPAATAAAPAAPAVEAVTPAPPQAAEPMPAVIASDAADLSWLLGTWELTYDPDGDEKDRLAFHEGGHMQLLAQDGRAFDGTYTLSGNSLTFAIQANGRTIELAAVVSEGRDRITNESGAYYTRLP